MATSFKFAFCVKMVIQSHINLSVISYFCKEDVIYCTLKKADKRLHKETFCVIEMCEVTCASERVTCAADRSRASRHLFFLSKIEFVLGNVYLVSSDLQPLFLVPCFLKWMWLEWLRTTGIMISKLVYNLFVLQFWKSVQVIEQKHKSNYNRLRFLIYLLHILRSISTDSSLLQEWWINSIQKYLYTPITLLPNIM